MRIDRSSDAVAKNTWSGEVTIDVIVPVCSAKWAIIVTPAEEDLPRDGCFR
jgi:hypothetical protein